MNPLPIKISAESREPIYHQIETQIKALIVSKQLPLEQPLPSIRSLAKGLSCSVITTRRAYQNLEQEGYITTIQGKGTFVNPDVQDNQEETKEQLLSQWMQRAIRQGFAMGFSSDELRNLFTRVLDKETSKKSKG